MYNTTMRYTSTIRGATTEDVVPACRMMWESYPDVRSTEPENYFTYYYACDPHFKPEQLRILWKDGRIAATVRVFIRRVYDGREYRIMGGIGNVATHPDFRGQGLSIHILRDALDYARSCGADYSSLYTDIKGLYERVGFEPCERMNLEGRVPGAPADLPRGRDMDRARALYDSSAGRYPGAFERSDEYWERWIKGNRLRGSDVAYSDGGEAYLAFSDESGIVEILDAGYDENPELLSSLISSVLAGRTVRVTDVDKDHCIVSALRPVLVDHVRTPASALMVAQLSDRPMPSRFCETHVDRF